MNISFIGLGKLGLPCAEKIADKGHLVKGYDIEPKMVRHVEQLPTIEAAVEDADIVFVAVPTPHDPKYDGREPSHHLPPKDFDYSIVNDVLDECNKHMNKRQLLVLISTVLPGTVRREFVHRAYNTRFLYNPYLIAMGTVAWDMVNPEMVMIGTEEGDEKDGDATTLINFYRTIMENNPRYIVGTWDECECIKVFYNTFISAKIGLVNMIQDVAVKQGNINVDVVTDALAHSDHRIMSPAYMKAGMGDGGACHPRDNIALRYMAQELDLGYDLFAEIMKARDIQAKNMAKEILKYGEQIKFTSDSYKPGVSYREGSYSLLVQHYVKELGGNITDLLPEVVVRVHPEDKLSELDKDAVVFDPWRGDADVRYGDTRCGI